MVRTYKRKPGSRKYCDFDEKAVNIAVSRYRDEGVSVIQLSEEYNILIATLYRKIKGKFPKKNMVASLQCQGVRRISLLTLLVLLLIGDIVQNYLERDGKIVPQFVNNRRQNFLLRHKEKLSKRLSQSIKETRAKVCHETINKYFDNLSESLKDVPSSAIVYYDETNFTDGPGRVKISV